MNLNITLDWRVVAALGTSAVAIILSLKLDEAAAERVSTHMVDAYRDYTIAINCNY